MKATLNAVQVSSFVDPERRAPEELLEAWPTLSDVAVAAHGDGVRVGVVQGAGRDDSIRRSGVTFSFVRGDAPGALRRRLGRWAHPVPGGLVASVADLEPDVIHVHSLGFPQLVLRLRRRFPDVPVLVQDHADVLPAPWIRWLHRRAFRTGVDAVSFTAREQAASWIDAGVIPGDVPVHQVLESSSHFRPGDRSAARDRTGLHGDPCLVWVGRLNENKDPLTVLRGVELAAEKLPDLRLWCCFSEAPLLGRVSTVLADSRLLRDRVELLGPVAHGQIEWLLRAADFFVLGSRREGSGYAALEALACGTPPLLTDIPSFRLITDGGRVGGLYPPGRADRLAELMVDRWNGNRDEVRREAREHFEAELSFAAVGEQLRAAYRSVIACGGAAS